MGVAVGAALAAIGNAATAAPRPSSAVRRLEISDMTGAAARACACTGAWMGEKDRL